MTSIDDSHMSTDPSPSYYQLSSPLFQLPAEIRNQIFDYVLSNADQFTRIKIYAKGGHSPKFHDSESICYMPDSLRRKPTGSAILDAMENRRFTGWIRSCRRAHDEATSVLYAYIGVYDPYALAKLPDWRYIDNVIELHINHCVDKVPLDLLDDWTDAIKRLSTLKGLEQVFWRLDLASPGKKGWGSRTFWAIDDPLTADKDAGWKFKGKHMYSLVWRRK